MNLLARDPFDRAARMVGAERRDQKPIKLSHQTGERRPGCVWFDACSADLTTKRTDLPDTWRCPAECPDYAHRSAT
jgi:hypothetical protein